jgi:lipopolysaccharide transport system permease protein
MSRDLLSVRGTRYQICSRWNEEALITKCAGCNLDDNEVISKSTKHYFSLVLQKSAADLISEARRGYLGILWWIIEPVIYMLVFYLIFVIVFNRGGEDRVAFLLTGLVVWKWFANSIPQCAISISMNIGLIRQVYIPKHVFPAMVVMTTTMKFLIVFVLLLIFLVVSGNSPSSAWLALPALMGLQLVVTLAIGGVLASIVPFIPDLKLIVDNGMMLLFFLSGVFFDISSASPEVKNYLYLNPMVLIIENYRKVLLDGLWPDWSLLGTVFSISLLGFALGWHLLLKYDRTYVKVI